MPGLGSHLHVVRRDDDNGAWAKSKRSRAVPVGFLLVQAYDQYVVERDACREARNSDFVTVAVKWQRAAPGDWAAYAADVTRRQGS